MSQVEPFVAVEEPHVYLSGTNDWVFTTIPDEELRSRRGGAGRRLGSERVLYLRVHDGQGKPAAYANVICIGTRLGALADEKGIAWLHGMPADSAQVKILTTFNGSGITWVVIRKGQLAGLDVQVSPAKPATIE